MNIWGAVEMDGREIATVLLGSFLGLAGTWVLFIFWLGAL